jgi:hypothetical protein
MHCANGTVHFFVEGTSQYVAVDFDAQSPDAATFLYMRDSVKIAGDR